LKINQNIASHKPVFHGGPHSIKKAPKDLMDFSSSINPLGASPMVKNYLKNHLRTISEYPDSESINLRKALQWYTKTPYEQIVIGNGATEIIYNFCHVFLNKNNHVLIHIPTFGEYEAAAKLSGCKISFFKTMNLGDDLDDFIQHIPRNGCVFVCNPNNPTGTLLSKTNLKKIIDSAKKKSTIVFVDESFIELVPDSNESIVKSIKKFNNLFVLRSMTKSFGLAGIRVGYGLGSKPIISLLNKIKIPWNVSGLAQYAAGAALCSASYLDKTRKFIKKESKYLQNSISVIDGFECYHTTTNFILIKTKMKSKIVQKKLLKKKILIRDCSTFRGVGDNYIRVAVKTRKENQKLIKALEEIK
jgi:threonine-phosphate decarboxylase